MTKSLARRLALAAAALAVVTQGSSALAADDPLRLTRPVHATKGDDNPNRQYSAPFLAVDPANQLNVVGSYADLHTRRCGLIRSTDGGQTWKRLEAAPAPPSYPFCIANNANVFQGLLAFGRSSTLYYTMAGWDVQDRSVLGGNFSVLVARSSNLGDSWQATIARNARGKVDADVENNRPILGISVDTKSGNDDIVYVAYQRGQTGRTAPNAGPTLPMVAVSTNGGRSFADPIDVSAGFWAQPAARTQALAATTTTVVAGVTPAAIPTPVAGSRQAQPDLKDNYGGRNPALTLDGKGNAYMFWHSATANLTPAPTTGHFLSKSTDKGRTWTTTQIAPHAIENDLGTRMAWSPKGGADGTLHMVQQRRTQPKVADYRAVVHRRSTDGGKTWSDPKVITDIDPAQLKGQYIPNISVAPNGRLDVAWWDTRDDNGIRGNDVYYSSSDDNGTTWSKNVRITDQTVDRKYGVWGVNYDMSGPPGVASTNAFAIFSWDDTRNTDTTVGTNKDLGGGLSDIYTSSAQYKAVGGATSNAAKAVLAGVVGLLVVGLVLLAVGLGARRRSGAPREPRKATDKASAEVG